jgi:hypothetical protein
VRPSRTRNLSEQLGVFRNRSPFRCRDCKERFIAPTFVWRDLFYARCPTCQRMDLNGWTGKTYTPPFWVGLKVTLGAHKFRCEYCRCNFAAFRRRKEVFTFKRWKAYGNSAEDYSLGETPAKQAAAAAGTAGTTPPESRG